MQTAHFNPSKYQGITKYEGRVTYFCMTLIETFMHTCLLVQGIYKHMHMHTCTLYRCLKGGCRVWWHLILCLKEGCRVSLHLILFHVGIITNWSAPKLIFFGGVGSITSLIEICHVLSYVKHADRQTDRCTFPFTHSFKAFCI